MSDPILRTLSAAEALALAGVREPLDRAALTVAGEIVEAIRTGGEAALRACAVELGDLDPSAPLVLGRADLERSLADLEARDRALLERAAERIAAFAQAQLESLSTVEIPLPGGRAGQRIDPVQRAGCYAPGGRFPLPSSVLMTAVTARAAGVDQVWVASPRPATVTCAAAAVAGADGLLCAGGAQAIAALAFGAGPVPPCNVVVGPGNRYVTAAKHLVSSRVGIDMLAGPSELVVLADAGADPAVVAADLLAQAEHDPDALPVLVAIGGGLIDRVNREIAAQIGDLPAAETARQALANGFAVGVGDIGEALAICDRLAPEHLELQLENAADVAARCTNFGALFIGASAAEVLGDYGAGPNHTLPTGGTARHAGGLSVLDFVRVRTWLAIDDPGAAAPLVEDAIRLAELEGLAAHARSAAIRRVD
jgi:phosphoribosyl-ATP pyrophosphohydrolase/phosphoribosyl-AMP cyclohydrolase/histidinol dehydrogenase